MKKRSPAFQIYPADILSDIRFRMMGPDERGIYFTLILSCWLEGVLPNDIRKLAAIAGIPAKRFERCWNAKIRQCFILDKKKNVFRHEHLEKEIRKQREFRRQRSEAGRASAAKRKREKEITHRAGSTTVERSLNPVSTKTNSPSSDSIPTLKDNTGGIDESTFRLYLEETIEGLRAALNLISLPNEQHWLPEIEWAFRNGYHPAEFIECFGLLRGQDWRGGRVSAKTVAENLPELDRLRRGASPVVERLPAIEEVAESRREARSAVAPPPLGKGVLQ